MSKNKLAKFAELNRLDRVIQVPYRELAAGGFAWRGEWQKRFFQNDAPIVLELGCGKGEYTVGLAELFPDKNFIGIDIKGARMWSGATEMDRRGLTNAAFIRTKVELLPLFFAPGEVSEIWITFPDPQMKKSRKRLTSTRYMALYTQFLKPGGVIHLKTDSQFLYHYTVATIRDNHFRVAVQTDDLYHSGLADEILSIQTYYEQQWLGRGKSIKYLQYEPHANDLIEPEDEIVHDDYRSFGRNATNRDPIKREE